MASGKEPDSAPRGCCRGFSSSESNPRVKSVSFVRWQILLQMSQQRAKGFSAGLVLVADSTSRSMALKAPETPQACARSCFGARSSRRNFGASLHKMARESEIRGHRIRAQRNHCRMAKCLCALSYFTEQRCGARRARPFARPLIVISSSAHAVE